MEAGAPEEAPEVSIRDLGPYSVRRGAVMIPGVPPDGWRRDSASDKPSAFSPQAAYWEESWLAAWRG